MQSGNISEDLAGAKVEVMEVSASGETMDCFLLAMVYNGVCLIFNEALPNPQGGKHGDVVVSLLGCYKGGPKCERGVMGKVSRQVLDGGMG